MNIGVTSARLGAGAVLFCAGALVSVEGHFTEAQAAPWLAPAADEHITAQWVLDVARELDRERNRQILTNMPSGGTQSAILGYLNDAAAALQDNQSRYAKDLVRKALGVLDEGVEFGWLSPYEVKPIKRMIVANFNRAARGTARSSAEQENEDGLARKRERWDGYTENRELGLTERLDVDRQSRQERARHDDQGSSYSDQRQSRDRQRDAQALQGRSGQGRAERGGTSRYYTDDFYYSDDANRPSRSSDRYREETDPRIMRDRAQHQRGRDRFYQQGEQPNEGPYDGEQNRGERG